MATVTEAIELQQREAVDLPKEDSTDTVVVGLEQTWKVPSINKYRVPVTFWSLAVRIRGKLEVSNAYLLDLEQNSVIWRMLQYTALRITNMLIVLHIRSPA